MIYISLGSNTGNRISNLRKAVRLLQDGILHNSFESIIIETKAILNNDAPREWGRSYLNMIIVGESTLSPDSLLKQLKLIEVQMGRELDSPRWSPRVIDLDILMYDDQVINSNDLQIPHKELLNRNFLVHLLAMMPEQYLPKLQIGNNSIRADEYAHQNIKSEKLFDNSFILSSSVMGILNITQDSFSDGGKNFIPDVAINNAYQMVKDGAEIIDIGAQSTRPSSVEIGVQKEYERLVPVLDGIKAIDAQISIDSYHPELILRLLKDYKIDWINDVTGNLDNETLKEISSTGAKILTMHSLSVPPTKSKVMAHDIKMIESLRLWAEEMINRMIICGFKAEDIVIDLGVGFGKSIYQNLSIIRGIKNFQQLGCKILIGHSRKSFIGGFTDSPISNRDIETMAISCNLTKYDVDFIRVHNVRDHYKLLVADKVSSL